MRPYLEKNPSQKVLMEWLKAKALSSNPSTTKKKKKKEKKCYFPCTARRGIQSKRKTADAHQVTSGYVFVRIKATNFSMMTTKTGPFGNLVVFSFPLFFRRPDNNSFSL
jgi:hypothetical protein